MTVDKYERQFENSAKQEQRSPAQRDRDRLLYSSAFRRLAGVTQVVGPLEGHIFHNRLTHTLEVAQVARRLAEKLSREHPVLARRLGGVDADVVEAAALAHDLGHPPFGHVAETELDRLAREHGDPDGFEGNAQSFRIISRLSAHRAPERYYGLNLTRATLNATLKYPWFRNLRDKTHKEYKKFGAYRSDASAFRFARAAWQRSSAQSIEASIMDYADSTAYSVHDLDDFVRAGLISVEYLKHDTQAFDRFLADWIGAKRVTKEQVEKYRERLLDLLWLAVPQSEPFTGTFSERAARRTATSSLIDEFINAVRLTGGGLSIPEGVRIEQGFLQRIVWTQVITAPSLATQHVGQKQVINRLFSTYLSAVTRREREVIPQAYLEELSRLPEKGVTKRKTRKPTTAEVRLAVDMVASLTDSQALLLNARFSGIGLGSVSDMLLA
ncbi:deoxyguanosinetriphosphate triphosphohydrolase family protein [Gemmatimonas sp.]